MKIKLRIKNYELNRSCLIYQAKENHLSLRGNEVAEAISRTKGIASSLTRFAMTNNSKWFLFFCLFFCFACGNFFVFAQSPEAPKVEWEKTYV